MNKNEIIKKYERRWDYFIRKGDEIIEKQKNLDIMNDFEKIKLLRKLEHHYFYCASIISQILSDLEKLK